MGRRSSRKTAAAGASDDAFLQRVRREISPAQYVRSIDDRVSERRKANKSAVKGAKADPAPPPRDSA